MPRTFAIALTVLITAFLALPLQAAETATKYNDWFGLYENRTADWDVIPGEDSRYVTIVRRDNGDLLAGAEERKILVVYRKPSSAYDTAMTQVLSVFAQKRVPMTLEVVFTGKDGPFTISTLGGARDQGFELIMAVGSSMVRSVMRNYPKALPAESYPAEALPVVTMTAKDPVLLDQIEDYTSGSGTNMAFTSLNASAETLFRYMVQLKPDLKNVGVLYAEENESAVQTQFIPMRDLSSSLNVTVHGVGVADRTQAREELATRLPAAIEAMRETDPDLSNSVFWITGSTSVFKEIDLINAEAGNIPVMSAVTNVVKQGQDSAVVAIGIGFESNAHLAAIYAMDILNGRDPGTMPVGQVNPPDIAINFMRARDIGMRIPFQFIEIAAFVYDGNGEPVRIAGQMQ